MKSIICQLVVIAMAIAFIPSCQKDLPNAPAQLQMQTSSISQTTSTNENRTPFQLSLIESIAKRKAMGLPVPSDVSFDCETDQGLPIGLLKGRGITPGEEITIVATTVIRFENPEEAGYEKWPDLVIEGEVPEKSKGFIKTGDYTQYVKEKIENEHPGIWDSQEFGTETRRYTITETYEIDSLEANAEKQSLEKNIQSETTSLSEILMGLTIPGPNLDYHIDWEVDIWFFGWIELVDFWAGFQLDWTVGLRLPMETAITYNEPMAEGSTYSPTSSIQGLDWSVEDFTSVGVPPVDGNEFVLQFIFKCGIFLDILDQSVIDLGVDLSLDETSSFKTPFGPGEYFDLPSLDIPVWSFSFGVAEGGVGFSLTPAVGSNKFTADWSIFGGASANGNITYNNSNTPVMLGSIYAIDGPANATILLNSLRYYFNQFLLKLGLYFELDVIVWGYNKWDLPITDFDLSALTGNIYVGPHSGTPGAVTSVISIQNVAPTAQINRDNCLLVNGVPSFMAHSGDQLEFTGNVTDPGLDDLTLIWDWDDGDPAPDKSTTYVTPYSVTEIQPHAFNSVGIYFVSFKAVDDDDDFDQDQVPVIITEADNTPGSEGYWQHQFNGVGNTDFDPLKLECLLEIVRYMSAVFNEARDVSNIAAAYDVLFLGKNKGDLQEQLDRELIVAWLNFAIGAYDYTEMLDTNDDDMGDTPFNQILKTAELVRLNPEATKAELLAQIEIVHKLKEMII